MKKTLTINDKIYGRIKINSPVIIEIIKSKPLQRIKKINQFGIPDEFYHFKNFSRYDHCIGTMLLLRKMGASEEEQIAGLLHDASHMAFSHVYDFLIEDHRIVGPKKEGAQDKRHHNFLNKTEIPRILKKYGLNPKKIINYHRFFKLLEKESPALCADRVDYSLKEMSIRKASKIFKGLTAFKNQIVCNDFKTAAIFGREYLKLQKKHWGGYEAVSRYTYFCLVLQRALKLKIIKKSDFLKDDIYIIKKLKKSRDPIIKRGLNILRKPLSKSKTGEIFYKKFRYIDPPFVSQNKLIALSKKDKTFKKLLAAAKKENKKGILVAKLI